MKNLEFIALYNRSPLMSPQGNTNFKDLKYYSAAKTGYEHLNKEEMVQVPEHVKEEMQKALVPDFGSAGKNFLL